MSLKLVKPFPRSATTKTVIRDFYMLEKKDYVAQCLPIDSRISKHH